MSDGTLGEAALDYAGRGWPIFPCHPRTARPATPGGAGDASADVRRVGRYWVRVPDANVALATGRPSGVAALVVDGAGGWRALAALEQAHGRLPDPLLACIGERAVLLYRIGEPRQGGALAEGVMLCADGGYVLLPPSRLGDEAVLWVDDWREKALSAYPSWPEAAPVGQLSLGG